MRGHTDEQRLEIFAISTVLSWTEVALKGDFNLFYCFLNYTKLADLAFLSFPLSFVFLYFS